MFSAGYFSGLNGEKMGRYIFTYLTIGITSLVSFYAFSNRSFMEKCEFSTGDIAGSKEYYRIFSSFFIHANTGHLVFNMFSLYAFAMEIEMKYGSASAAYIYLLSGTVSGLLSLCIHRKDKNYRALGASGAVCGIIFASIFLIPGGSIIVFPIPIPLPAWAYALLFVFGSIYASGRMAGGIAHDAHLGGALAGIFTAGTIDPHALTSDYPLLAAAVIPILLFFVFNSKISAHLRKEQ